MSTPALQNRCANHDSREAVCRCPACGRAFCRECVTEHDELLLCASCIARSARRMPAARPRTISPWALAACGLFLAWVVYFAAIESLVTISERAEHIEWQEQ